MREESGGNQIAPPATLRLDFAEASLRASGAPGISCRGASKPELGSCGGKIRCHIHCSPAALGPAP